MPPKTPTSRELARRLIDAESKNARAPGSAASAAHRACEHLYHHLARWVGKTGGQALFERALQTARGDYPVLSEIALRTEEEPGLGGVDEATRAFGGDVTAAGLEGLLIVLIELLGRFIGEDMVTTLAEQSYALEPRVEVRTQDGRDRREEA